MEKMSFMSNFTVFYWGICFRWYVVERVAFVLCSFNNCLVFLPGYCSNALCILGNIYIFMYKVYIHIYKCVYIYIYTPFEVYIL